MWPDEADRPVVAGPQEARTGSANQQFLVQVHDHLRSELDSILDGLTALDDGGDVGVDYDESIGEARALLQRLTMRQNHFSLGAFCAAWCRTVATHHTIEDQHMFVGLRAAEPELAPVLDRLEAEHVVVAAMLVEIDEALVALVAGTGTLVQVHAVARRLGAALRSHLSYEEDQLLPALGRSTSLI